MGHHDVADTDAQGTSHRGVRAWLGRRWLTGPAWTGAALAIAATALGLWLWRAVEQVMSGAAAASWRILASDLLLAIGAGAVVLLILTGVAALLRCWRWPAPFLAVLVGALLLLLTMGAGASQVAWLLSCVIALLAAGLIGAGLGRLLPRRDRAARPRGAALTAGAGAMLALLLAAAVVWPGAGASTPSVAAVRGGDAPEDPSAAGPFEVRTTTYGGAEPGLAEHYASVDVVTEPVDASGVLSGWDPGSTRTQVWGFDASALPVNGTVWSPADDGPRPLVLIAHGNSPHADSDLGFDYLGELLASRGYVVASLDMSFLNTGVLDRSGGLIGADLARAWLVVQHLRQWEAWQDGDGPADGPVDLAQVALIGHSRGGEAVAAAAALIAAGSGPDLPGADLSTDAQVRTVVALAPSDGLIPVGGEPVRLEGLNYLTLAGSHDADVGAFAGSNQYARTVTTADTVKAAIAIHRADHAQFNSEWGSHDVGLGLAKHVLDRAALLDPQEQRQVTTVLVSAFLDRTLRGDEAAGALFDGDLPEVDWLPQTGYRVAAASGERDEVVDFTDASMSGAAVQTPVGPLVLDAASGTVAPLPLRVGTSGNAILHLGLNPGRSTVAIPVDDPSPQDRVVVDLARRGSGEEIVTATLEVADTAGVTASCPVTGEEGIPDHLSGRTVKLGLLQSTPLSEPALQTYAVPLTCAADAGVDDGSVESVTLVLAGATATTVLVDNIGLVPGPAAVQ